MNCCNSKKVEQTQKQNKIKKTKPKSKQNKIKCKMNKTRQEECVNKQYMNTKYLTTYIHRDTHIHMQ